MAHDQNDGGVLRTALPGGYTLTTEWAGDGDFRQLDPAPPPRPTVAEVSDAPVARAVAEVFGCPDVHDRQRLIRAAEFAAMVIRHQPCQCPPEPVTAACVRCAALGELRAVPRRPR